MLQGWRPAELDLKVRPSSLADPEVPWHEEQDDYSSYVAVSFPTSLPHQTPFTDSPLLTEERSHTEVANDRDSHSGSAHLPASEPACLLPPLQREALVSDASQPG